MFRLFVGIILFTAALFHGKDYKNHNINNETKIELSKEVSVN